MDLCVANRGCSTWKCLWKAGLGRRWGLNMSVSSPFSSSVTSIIESIRESTADSCASAGITGQKLTQLYSHLQCEWMQLLSSNCGGQHRPHQQFQICANMNTSFQNEVCILTGIFCTTLNITKIPKVYFYRWFAWPLNIIGRKKKGGVISETMHLGLSWTKYCISLGF